MQVVARAIAAADIMEIFFRRDNNRPPTAPFLPVSSGGDDEEEFTPIDRAISTPAFSAIMLDNAVEQGIIAPEERVEWERVMIPPEDDEDLWETRSEAD
jgi:hypothetical protein